MKNNKGELFLVISQLTYVLSCRLHVHSNLVFVYDNRVKYDVYKALKLFVL